MRAFLFLMVLVASAAVSRADENTAPAASDSPKADAAAAVAPAADEKKADEKKADEKKADETSAEKKDEKKSDAAATDAKKDTAAAPEVKPAEAPSAPTAQVTPEAAPLSVPEAAPMNAPAAAKEVGASTGTPAGDDKKASEGPAGKVAPSALGLHYGVGLSFFTGVQTDPELQGGYIGLSPSVSYGLTEKITVSGGLSPVLNFKYPGSAQYVPGDNRRIDNNPGFSAIRLSAADIFVEETTGIHLSGNVAYYVPLNWTNLFGTNKSYGDTSVGAGLSRKFGGLSVSLIGGFRLFGFANAATPRPCGSDPGLCDKNQTFGVNPWYSLLASAAVRYSHGPWTGSISLGANETALRLPSTANEPYNTNDHANLHFGSSFIASVAYELDDHLSVNGGLFNGGPQITSIDGINNPFFKDQFAGLFAGVDWSH